MNPDIEYLLSLQAVRERAHAVLGLAKEGKLSHFEYHDARMDAAADFVQGVIERDFGPSRYHLIPPHGRWQHFEVGGQPRLDGLLAEWSERGLDALEKARSLYDLFFVSVLLDAGAGDAWSFHEVESGQRYSRSEGIAVASLYMFKNGAFASPAGPTHRRDVVDGHALSNLTEETLSQGFQISKDNPMAAVGSRATLLARLGKSLLQSPSIFGPEGRPGNLVDYLLRNKLDDGSIAYETLWRSLQQLLIPAWPEDRTHIDGQPIGDAWPLATLERNAASLGLSGPTSSIQPFHKLTQWLAYSLTVPIERLLGVSWTGTELGTGLPEYRNGGLFVDLDVLTLKDAALQSGRRRSGQDLPLFGASDDEIVEWRAMTVALLDELHQILSKRFLKNNVTLTMAQMLEAGSWKSGRELAAARRPETRSSPILIQGDGTLF